MAPFLLVNFDGCIIALAIFGICRYLHPDQNGVGPTNFYNSRPQRQQRNHSITPTRLYPPSATEEQTMSINMLQSMSMSLSDIQAQLSMMQQQYHRHDEQMKELQDSIKVLQEKPHANCVITSTASKSRKSPRGLSVS